MYAGVPTVDLGFECSSDDCNQKDRSGEESISATARANDFLLLVQARENEEILGGGAFPGEQAKVKKGSAF
jgi:hypothetical protein